MVRSPDERHAPPPDPEAVDRDQGSTSAPGQRSDNAALLQGVVPPETLRYHSPLQENPDTERMNDG